MPIVLTVGFGLFILLQCCVSDDAKLLYKILPGILCCSVGCAIIISTVVGMIIQFLAIRHLITGIIAGAIICSAGIWLFKLANSKKGL